MVAKQPLLNINLQVNHIKNKGNTQKSLLPNYSILLLAMLLSYLCLLYVYSGNIFLMFYLFILRERERAQREGEREFQAGSSLSL